MKIDEGEVLYNYVDCSCKKDIPNEQHTCKKIRRSRLSDAATETTVEIETWKLVGGTPVPWKKQIADQKNFFTINDFQRRLNHCFVATDQ